MKPAVGLVLSTMVDDMHRKLAFVPPGGERMMMAGMKVMLGIVARQADDAAALRVAEIEALGVLFRRALAKGPSPLAERLQAAVSATAEARRDLRISALEVLRDRQLETLIALQAWLEETPDPSLSEACWDFLVRANARRQVPDKPW